MASSGAQDLLERNPGYYQSLLGSQHDPKLVETICTGQALYQPKPKAVSRSDKQLHHFILLF